MFDGATDKKFLANDWIVLTTFCEKLKTRLCSLYLISVTVEHFLFHSFVICEQSWKIARNHVCVHWISEWENHSTIVTWALRGGWRKKWEQDKERVRILIYMNFIFMLLVCIICVVLFHRPFGLVFKSEMYHMEWWMI